MEILDNLAGSVKGFMKALVREGEERLTLSFYRMKRKVFRFALEITVFMLGLVFVLAGLVLVLDRYFGLEWVLLITGLLMLNIVLLTAKFR